MSERTALVLVAAVLGAVCTRQGDRTMRDDALPVAHDVAVPGSDEVSGAPGVPGAGPDVGKPFVDEGHTSRAPVALGKGEWRVAWSAGLDARYPFQHVVAAGRRVALVGRANPRWQLFDDRGRELVLETLVAGDVLLDPGSGLVYLPGIAGTLDAYKLDDGKLAWRLLVHGNEDWARVLVARRGARLITASFEQALDPHGGGGGAAKMRRGVVEVHELAARDVVKEGYLESAVEKGKREVPTRRLVAALAGDTLVVASTGQIDFGGLDLTVTASYSGDPFEPLALSADARGGAYLIVTAGGKRALWRVGLDGKRVAVHALPEEGVLLAPPIVGADLTAHVAVGDKILAFTDKGSKWERVLPKLVGASATSDGKLVVSAGTELVALDGMGAMTVLFSFRGEKLATAPLLARDGKLLVATADRLYALER